MTCIVGYSLKDKVYIGGDSAGVDVNSFSLTIRRDPKVFKNGPAIMGFTSSFRMGDLLHHALVIPERHPDEDIDKWLRTTFINAVRDCLKSGGFAEKEKEAESGGTFLLGYEGRLFAVYDNYQVEESVDPYNAVGCGADYAKGAMAAMIQAGDHAPRDYDSHCSGNYRAQLCGRTSAVYCGDVMTSGEQFRPIDAEYWKKWEARQASVTHPAKPVKVKHKPRKKGKKAKVWK